MLNDHAISGALTRMDGTPAPVAMKDFTIGQLEAMHQRVGELIELHERMSGACATMQGLVLMEIKRKLPHGKWQGWVAGHYRRSGRSASDYMRMAEAFLRESHAEQPLVLALMAAAGEAQQQIDLAGLDASHPAVAPVLEWCRGRSAHQLLLDLGPVTRGGYRGGGDGRQRPVEPTAEEAAELARGLCRGTAGQMADIFKRHAYIALSEAEMAGLQNHCEALAGALRNWQGMTRAQREEQIGKWGSSVGSAVART